MPDRSPFRKTELSDEDAAKMFHNSHDLREMYTRENTERRRAGAHTLRKYLTTAQDKLLTAHMTKIRDEYETSNNDDVVVVFVQKAIADGKAAEFAPQLVEFAKKAVVPKRTTPVY